jgi:hypothetical protein
MEEVSGDPLITVRSPWRCAGCWNFRARGEPVLTAVDDVQWLDPSSSAALAFALRRLPSEHVRLLLARRLVDEARPVELVLALDARQVRRMRVGPPVFLKP